MNESEPRRNAESYLSIQKKYMVIPESEPIGLIQVSRKAGLKRQKERRRRINQRQQYLTELGDILQEASISPFFREQLLYEAELDWVNEVISQESVDEIANDLLGISREEEKAGIFDPKLSFVMELRFFRMVRPLLEYREHNGFPNAVSWREWEQYLEQRSKGES